MSVDAYTPPPLKQRVFYRLCWLIAAFCSVAMFRPRIKGRRNIPQSGPVLLLANHTATFDPVNVGFPCVRQVHFMASEQLFRISPWLGWLITNLNAFPKAKGVKDRGSVLELVKRYKAGNIVNLYPEGERTWTGRPLPIVPSTPRLLKRLQARVVYARIVNGHLSHPRWAKYPRWIRLELEYSPVFVYDDPDRPDEEILAEMEDQLRVIPEEVNARGLGFGWRMAYGLPEFLWACPSCFAQDALEVARDSGNAVVCSACTARWRIDVSQRLFGENAQARDTRVVTAYDSIISHYGEPPVSDRARHEAEGVVLETDASEIWQIHRDQKEPTVLGSGTARLTPERIGVYGADGTAHWELPLPQIKAVLASVGNRLQIRTADANYQLNPASESRNKWQHFIRSWWQLSRSKET